MGSVTETEAGQMPVEDGGEFVEISNSGFPRAAYPSIPQTPLPERGKAPKVRVEYITIKDSDEEEEETEEYNQPGIDEKKEVCKTSPQKRQLPSSSQNSFPHRTQSLPLQKSTTLKSPLPQAAYEVNGQTPTTTKTSVPELRTRKLPANDESQRQRGLEKPTRWKKLQVLKWLCVGAKEEWKRNLQHLRWRGRGLEWQTSHLRTG